MRRFPGSVSRTGGVWDREARSQIADTGDLETTPNLPTTTQASSPHSKAQSTGPTSRQKISLQRAVNASSTQDAIIPEPLSLWKDHSIRNPLPVPPRVIPPYDPGITSYEDRLEFLRGQSTVMPAVGSSANNSGSDGAQPGSQQESALSPTNAPSRTVSLSLAAEEPDFETGPQAQAQADSQRRLPPQVVDEDSAREGRQDATQIEEQEVPQAPPDHRLFHLAHWFMLNRERFSHVGPPGEQWTSGDIRRYMDPLMDAANEFLRALSQLPETLQVTGDSLLERYQELRDTFPHSRADLFDFIRQTLADLAEHAQKVYRDAGEPLTFAFTPPAYMNSIEATAFFTPNRTQSTPTASYGSMAPRTSASFSLLNPENTEGRTPDPRLAARGPASHLGPDMDLNDTDSDTGISGSPLLQHPIPLPAPGSTPYHATMELDATTSPPQARQRGWRRRLILPEGHWSLPTGNSPPLEDPISVPSISTVPKRHNQPDSRTAKPTRSILRNPSTTAQHRQGLVIRIAEGRTEVPPSPDTSQRSSSSESNASYTVSSELAPPPAAQSSWADFAVTRRQPSPPPSSQPEPLAYPDAVQLSPWSNNPSRPSGSRVSDWEDLSSVGRVGGYWIAPGYRTPPPGYPSTPASRAGSVTPPPSYWSTPVVGSASRSYPPPGYWSTPVSEATLLVNTRQSIVVRRLLVYLRVVYNLPYTGIDIQSYV